MYDGRRKTNRCLTSYRATKTHCSEKGNYWNFTLFWGIRVRESPGFFFYHFAIANVVPHDALRIMTFKFCFSFFGLSLIGHLVGNMGFDCLFEKNVIKF